MNYKKLQIVDKEIFDAINAEKTRQDDHLELIASENYVSKAVLDAMGSPLTNKYAEGYPGKRYYGGCECVDVVENIARDRLKKLFGCDHANVQPHSGSNANLAVYFALLNTGDTILGMNLSDGGHLTHGSKVNFSGKWFNVISYNINDEGYIDYKQVQQLAKQYRPKLIVAGASAYPRKIDFKKFRKIADSVDAYLMVDIAHIAGLVVANKHPSPIPYADVVTSTTHKTLRGPRGGIIMCKENLAAKIDKAIFPGTQGGPLMHIIAAKAVAFKEALEPSFKRYISNVIKNAKAMEEIFLARNVNLVSGGTDNHLLLLDLSDKDISGKELEELLDKANISTNKNTVHNEKRSPMITSGLRIGTPAITTRGLKEDDCRQIANIICDIIENKEKAIEKAKQAVAVICNKYPIKY